MVSAKKSWDILSVSNLDCHIFSHIDIGPRWSKSNGDLNDAANKEQEQDRHRCVP